MEKEVESEINPENDSLKTITIPLTDFEKLEKEAFEYKDKYLRLLAEMDNMRKRMQKEKQEVIQYATENLILEFLTPTDQFENALQYTEKMSDEIKHWAFGFQMILKQYKDVLANNKVTSFASVGKPFDPQFHEAVEMVESKDVPPGNVVEESLKGYKIGDRVIRPARVKVSKN